MERVQSYEIINVIGYGGMGVVYKARHLVTGEMRAIKKLHTHLVLDEQVKYRFLEEAKIIGHLDHKNIIKVYELLEHAGDLYMIMEYVQGRPLSEMISKVTGPIPSEKALNILRQICEGLDYAHRNKLVHRDIKPANILVDEHTNVKLADFGIAKVLDRTQHTSLGTIIGTIAYMSPEQIEGTDIDQRADIYSLGITLYEMLAGRLPYAFRENDSLVKKINEISNARIPDPRTFYPHIPDYMVTIVNRCIEKNRDLRYASVRSVLTDLDRGRYSIESDLDQGYGNNTFRQVDNKNVEEGDGEYSHPAAAPKISGFSLFLMFTGAFLIIIALLYSNRPSRFEAPATTDSVATERPVVDTSYPAVDTVSSYDYVIDTAAVVVDTTY